MIKQISEDVWKFYFNNLGSNCYLVKIAGKKILIDTSSTENRNDLVKDLSEIFIKQKDISAILLTHMHYDHIGNLLIFKNAKAYASKKEILDFCKDYTSAILAEILETRAELIKSMLCPISEFKNESFRIIETPGHTRGSIAFYMPKEKILFSGDTLFDDGIGRVDLPTSQPEKMSDSLRKLKNLGYKILCPGH